MLIVIGICIGVDLLYIGRFYIYGRTNNLELLKVSCFVNSITDAVNNCLMELNFFFFEVSVCKILKLYTATAFQLFTPYKMCKLFFVYFRDKWHHAKTSVSTIKFLSFDTRYICKLLEPRSELRHSGKKWGKSFSLQWCRVYPMKNRSLHHFHVFQYSVRKVF